MPTKTNKNIELLDKAMKKQSLNLNDVYRATGVNASAISQLLKGKVRFTDAICARLSLAGLASFETMKVNQAKYDAATMDFSQFDDVTPNFFK